ncbi:hypothetical protein BCR41DRAFT_109186 [Lobosporangium transversale]|uniref:Uncharacterized protein n=1 Tax=Lobosporangium transversale TaxID=64571 RepID=A0A1Y2GHC5_9FUNG|nr:hypothetical protein BCR41DRAFT_114060 [Lobosporangium transversale]XP_021879851.1 hypothetical protein BCR41DRAFT_109186 [Lobosporangium transversale]ORZ10940.1 hypothetical protein BCR41DRAFT_114060 [Lobosporangium transversale]ORZ11754.1 hypothetical protein BCR41DRAFT_109186 [Lobosporangium transversale]|eukprot:XP_021879457.1 hypothetical protein BCR41DRAFT_114060 [Lobosporangium transversale]
MASSEDGRIVVIFGGRIPANMTATPPTNFTSTLYVLNVTSSIWSQEKSAPTPRLYTACIIIGNQFISWGGYDGLNTVSATPMIFDLTKRQWTKSYSPPDYYVNASHPSPRQPKSSPAEPFLPVLPSQSGSVNMVVILGGTFGALFVVALAGIVYLYMKRKSDRQLHDLKTQQEQSKDGAQAFASGSEKPDMSTNPNQQTPPHAYGRNPHAVVQNSHIVERHPQDAVAMGLVHDYTPVHVHTLNNQHSPIPVRHDATTIPPYPRITTVSEPPRPDTIINQPYTLLPPMGLPSLDLLLQQQQQ